MWLADSRFRARSLPDVSIGNLIYVIHAFQKRPKPGL